MAQRQPTHKLNTHTKLKANPAPHITRHNRYPHPNARGRSSPPARDSGEKRHDLLDLLCYRCLGRHPTDAYSSGQSFPPHPQCEITWTNLRAVIVETMNIFAPTVTVGAGSLRRDLCVLEIIGEVLHEWLRGTLTRSGDTAAEKIGNSVMG